MKTPKVITDVEHQAARQLDLLMRAVRQQYKRFVTGTKTSPAVAQRRFIRSVEKTIDSAEDIIAELKPRIASVKRSLAGPKRSAKRAVKRAKAATKRAPTSKRTSKARKKKQ